MKVKILVTNPEGKKAFFDQVKKIGEATGIKPGTINTHRYRNKGKDPWYYKKDGYIMEQIPLNPDQW